MADRVTYRGSQLFLNDNPVHRASAFGSTTGFTKEDLFELGNAGLVEVIDDIPNVDISLDTNEYGSLRTLSLLAGKSADNDVVDFSNDFENALVDFYVTIKASPTEIWTQYIERCALNSASFSFNIDGNFTESYSLNADNKVWLLNGGKFVTVREKEVEASDVSAEKVTLTFEDNVAKVLAVFVNGVRDEERTVTSTGSSVEVAVGAGDAGKTIVVRASVAAAHADDNWITDTESAGAKRKGHIEVFLLENVKHNSGSGVITNDTSTADPNKLVEHKLSKAQTVSIDASMDREELKELGSSKAYARPMNFPMNVDVSFDILHADLDFFAMLVSANSATATELNIDNARNDLGLRIKIYKERDIDDLQGGDRTLLKRFDVPYLIPNDENWNVSLDGNATQTFSFRSHELAVLDMTD